jgi:hypothetical protein
VLPSDQRGQPVRLSCSIISALSGQLLR